MQIFDYLIETSDRCIRIADQGRRLLEELDAAIGPVKKEPFSKVSANGHALADELQSLGRGLLAKAVELDTQRQKNNPGTFGP
jgi:hypothetical protein